MPDLDTPDHPIQASDRRGERAEQAREPVARQLSESPPFIRMLREEIEGDAEDLLALIE